MSTLHSLFEWPPLLDGWGHARVRALRVTRLMDLVNTMDAKLVAAAFRMDPESAIAYLADHVDSTTTFEAAAHTPLTG